MNFSRTQSQSVEDARPANWPSRNSITNRTLGSFRPPSPNIATGSRGSRAISGASSDADAGRWPILCPRGQSDRPICKWSGKRLGSLGQRLSYAVGQAHLDTALAGDPNARQSTPVPPSPVTKTPWLKIDDYFFEARGYTWALLQSLKAMQIDFAPVLEDKNAMVSIKQIIRELENTQKAVWSPAILNGTGFGPMANHSLIDGVLYLAGQRGDQRSAQSARQG